MIRFLISAVTFIASAALGLWVTSLIVDGFELRLSGFVVTVLVFAVLQSILTPFIASMTQRYARALLGGVGLVSTFVALLIAQWLTAGLTITGVSAWIASTVLVWLVTALATLLLPLLFVKKKVAGGSAGSKRAPKA